jgi:magnesium transporter
MFYLSQLLGAPVEDLHGVRVGKVTDVIMPTAQASQLDLIHPSALLVEGSEEQPLRVPVASIRWQEHVVHLLVTLEQLSTQPTVQPSTEVSLVQDVLDKQVIDIMRKKAVRVNDVCFSDDWQILGIDNSTLGLVRRLAPAWLLGTKSRNTPTNLIPWRNIELIGSQSLEEHEQAATPPAHRRAVSGQLAELRPADIAEIVHQLTPGQGARLIEGLDDETAADAMQEIDTDRQRHILENIPAARAADILETMEPDEAADLLAQLPEERTQELLSLMKREESEDVQELLEYEEDTAGGLMTTDYIVLTQTRSASEALDEVRSIIQEQDIRPAYVYCVADESQDECRLLGVVSIWDLLTASPSQLLQELMKTDLITVQPDTDPRTVAQVMAKYNLLAVPVVNQDDMLEGVVTVDDALDVLLPPDRRRKPTRMY